MCAQCKSANVYSSSIKRKRGFDWPGALIGTFNEKCAENNSERKNISTEINWSPINQLIVLSHTMTLFSVHFPVAFIENRNS